MSYLHPRTHAYDGLLTIHRSEDCHQIGSTAIMLPGAARSPCLRFPRRFAHGGLAAPRTALWATAWYEIHSKAFTSANSPLRKDASKEPALASNSKTTNPIPTQASASVNPPKDARNATTAKKDLLSETTLANKEQRKADWAIIKEMAKYLWPKVWYCEAFIFLGYMGIDRVQCRMTGEPNFVLEQRSPCWLEQR